MPRRSGKFKRCVAKVSRRAGIDDPAAVCAASLRKVGWKPRRRNAGLTAAYKAAISENDKAIAAFRSAQLAYHSGKIRDSEFLAARAAYDAAMIKFDKAYVKATRHHNPASTAATLSEAFHGRPVQEEIEIDEELHVHKHLAGLGTLDSITLEDGAELEDFRGAQLASNEDGTQLFIIGGDQSVSLRRFDVDETKERILLGQVEKIVYTTDKQHLGRADRKRGPYQHTLGEESGELPALVYGRLNERLEFVGGSYTVEPEGIRD